MPTTIVDRNLIDQLNAYPMIVTGQIVVDTAALARRSSTQKADGPALQHQRPFARLHHTSKFGLSR
jgi:hypothetical protein